MKNLRKVLAFTLALAMLLGTMTTTFAANEKVQALETLKLVDVQTKEGLANDLTRAVGLATVLKAKGYTQDDANAKAADVKFTDVTKEWQKGWTVLGQEAGVIEGTGEGKFNPEGKLSKKDFTRMMLRTLGYSVEETRGDLADLVAKTALVESLEDDKFTKEEALEVMFDALKVKVKEGDMTLAQKLVKDGRFTREQGQEVGVCQAQPDKLMVESVVADNLVEARVMFNGEVDKDSAEKAGNYVVKGGVVESAKLKEGYVLLTFKNPLTNKKDYELTVSNVKNAAGVAMEKATVSMRVEDNQIPEIFDVTITGPRNFVVKFSEPLQTYPTVIIKQGNNTLGSSHEGNGTYRAYSSFQEGKEYILQFGNVKSNDGYATDFAGYKSLYKEHTFTYAKDTVAPTVELVKATAKEVVVKFSKPVDNVDLTNGDNFAHSYSSITASEAEYDKKTDTYKATFAQYLTPGEVKIYVMAKANGKTIQDKWGNVLADTVLMATVVKDDERPTVTAVEATSGTAGTNVKVTFSEELKDEAVKLVILDDAGKKITELTKKREESDKKVVKFFYNKELSGKTVSLVISEAKDNSVSENKMDQYTETVTFTDSELKPLRDAKVRFFKADETKNTKGFLYITFEEDMDDSALDLENYRVNGTYKLQGYASFLEGNRKVVAIELTSDTSKTDGEATVTDMKVLTNKQWTATALYGSPKLHFSSKLKDVAGNAQGQFEALAVVSMENLTEVDGAEVGYKVFAKATNLVEVEFDAPISLVDGVTLNDKKNNTNYVLSTADNIDTPSHQVVQVTKKSDKVLELMVEAFKFKQEEPVVDIDRKLLPTDPETAPAVKLFLRKDAVKDVFGRTTVDTGVEVKDKVAPEVAKDKFGGEEDKFNVVLKTFAHLGTRDAQAEVEITYTENLEGKSISLVTYSLNNGWGVAKVTPSDKTVKLLVKKDKGTQRSYVP